MEKRETEEARWARLRERRRWSTDDAKWVVEAWAASGETMAAFADGHGIHQERVRRSRRRLDAHRVAPGPAAGGPRGAARAVALVPVSVRGSTALAIGDGAVVVYAGGVQIAIRDLSATPPEWVARLVGGLAAERAP
jgi:transposase-like protein